MDWKRVIFDETGKPYKFVDDEVKKQIQQQVYGGPTALDDAWEEVTVNPQKLLRSTIKANMAESKTGSWLPKWLSRWLPWSPHHRQEQVVEIDRQLFGRDKVKREIQLLRNQMQSADAIANLASNQIGQAPTLSVSMEQGTPLVWSFNKPQKKKTSPVYTGK